MTASLLLAKPDSRDAGFIHAVSHRPEVSLTGIYLKYRQQRVAGVGNAEVLDEGPFLDTFSPDFRVGDDFNFAGDPHYSAEVFGLKIYFYLGVFLQLFVKSLGRLSLKPEAIFIGIPHPQASYSGLVAFCGCQIASFIFVGEFYAIFEVHLYLLSEEDLSYLLLGFHLTSL
jgi:hypothetical protein